MYLRSLNPNKVTGPDQIPARFLRDGAVIIIGPLTHLINLSIITGTVPDQCKLAKVKPIYKKDDRTDTNNFLPVSFLSCTSVDLVLNSV